MPESLVFLGQFLVPLMFDGAPIGVGKRERLEVEACENYRVVARASTERNSAYDATIRATSRSLAVVLPQMPWRVGSAMANS